MVDPDPTHAGRRGAAFSSWVRAVGACDEPIALKRKDRLDLLPMTGPGSLSKRTQAGALSRILLTTFVAILVVSLGPALGSHSAPGTPLGAASFSLAVSNTSFPTPIRHVMVVMLENQERQDVLANGTFEQYLAARFASGDQVFAPMHYSLPNYLAITSGYMTNYFGAVSKPNVGTLSQSAGRTWKEYEESMPKPCYLVADPNNTAPYDYWHNPFAMYNSMVQHPITCAQHMVNFTRWSSDLAHQTVPNYALLIANSTNDGHDTGLVAAESWLSTWLSPLINSSLFRTTAVFVTYDEGTTNLGANGSSGGGRVFFAVASPFARPGFISHYNYTHLNLLTTTEWLLGLGRTGINDSWQLHPPMQDLFSFPSEVRGTVVDALGAPVANALVSNHAGVSTYTNSSGGFVLLLGTGTWTVYGYCKGVGYGNTTATVTSLPVSGLSIILLNHH
jgi:hypothetical protein